MTLALRYTAVTDVGRGQKASNEDSGFANRYLLAVADGMGGMVSGDLASALTIGTVRQIDPPALADADHALEALNTAMQRANRRIAERIAADPRLEGMGTTLSAAIVRGDQLALAHIGDSRAYLLRAGSLRQITHDHTFVQSLVDEGRLTLEEAAHHPHRALITRALQGEQEVAPDLTILDLVVGDRLLFCSDGLDNAGLDDVTIAEILVRSPTPDDAARALVDRALEEEGPDNVTCVVGDVVDDESGGSPAVPRVVGAAAELDTEEESAAEITATEEVPTLDPVPADGDDEELRYAPQPPKRFRWLRRTAFGVVVLAFVGAALWAGYTWTQAQYYVGAWVVPGANADDGTSANGVAGGTDGDATERLAIYRGIAQRVPGLRLSDPVEVRDLDLQMLPSYHRELVRATISAENMDDARGIVAELERVAAFCREERPDPDQQTDEDGGGQTNSGGDDGSGGATGSRDNSGSDGDSGSDGSQRGDAVTSGSANDDETERGTDRGGVLAGAEGPLSDGTADIPLNCDDVSDPTETR